MTTRTLRQLPLALTTLVLAGCQGLHLHDPGRLEAASAATTLAKDFSSEGTAVFKPMEENLDAFTGIEAEILTIANKYELETFTAIAAGQRADEVAFELFDTMADWQANIAAFDAQEQAVITAVNDALDRQNEVAKLLTAKEKSKGEARPDSLDATLERVNKRLDRMEDGVKVFLKAFDAASGLAGSSEGGSAAKAVGTLDEDTKANAEKIDKWIAAAKDALDSVEKDEQLVAARALLAATIQEQLAAERERISEHRRYLGEVRRLRQTFDVRERVAVCHLFTPAFYRVLPGIVDDGGADPTGLADTYDALSQESRYTEDGFCAFADIRDADGKFMVSPGGRADWGGGTHTLARYVAANIARLGARAQGAELVAALGILAFVERPFLDNAVQQLAVERTRHTIRLSKINAQQRADLLRSLASSLEIYEQGGIKPEEIARLALMASQVGALFFIGAES